MKLLEKISEIDFLKKAWKNLNKSNKKSRGISKETIETFANNLDKNLKIISSQLKKGNYRFHGTRAAVMKKDNGKYRPLQIPEVKDRVVLKAISILLEEELENQLKKSKGISFAYQKGIGVKDATLKMEEKFNKGERYVLKADIVNFFEEVDRNNLINNLVLPNLSDNSINDLIIRALNIPLKRINQLDKKHRQLFKNRNSGIPQGNPISPLLSNLYLASFDKEITRNGYSLVRYADDFIITTKTKNEALNAHEIAKKILLDSYNLKIHDLSKANDSKTKIFNIDKPNNQFSFLSIRYDGKNLYPKGKNIRLLKSKLRETIHSHNSISDAIKEIYLILNRWISRYKWSDIDRYFKRIDSYIVSQLRKRFDKNRYYSLTSLKELAEKQRKK